MPIVNARMYSVTAECRADWHRVRLSGRADLEWPRSSTTTRLRRSPRSGRARHRPGDDVRPAVPPRPRPTLVAAPVPGPALWRPAGLTDIVVAASPHRTLEDTLGGIVGYTLADSMSGAVARAITCWCAARGAAALPRGRRARQRARRHRRLADGRIDVGPLDGYSR
jgi:hypothetical protein